MMKQSIDQALFLAKQFKNAGDVARAVQIYEDLLLKHNNNKKLRARLLALIDAVRPNIGNSSRAGEITTNSWLICTSQVSSLR